MYNIYNVTPKQNTQKVEMEKEAQEVKVTRKDGSENMKTGPTKQTVSSQTGWTKKGSTSKTPIY